MKKFINVLLIVISVALLAISLFFAVGFSLDIGDLINPISIIGPIMITDIAGVGSVLLLIASVKRYKGQPAKRYFVLATCFFALALALIPITRAVNKQIILNMFR